MQLSRIGYHELAGEPGEWVLEPFSLQQTNLIVGRNSTGKSRTLNVVAGLARLLSSGEATSDGNFDATFVHDRKIYIYRLHINKNNVIAETLHIGRKLVLDRNAGKIWSDTEKKYTLFKTRDNQIAANAKLDLLQTKFLEPLVNWANSVFHFHFSSSLGQMTMTLGSSGTLSPNDVNLKDENQTAQIYRHGFELFGDAFDQAIVSDMQQLGYDISEVGLGDLPGLRAPSQFGLQVVGAYVLERGISQRIGQHAMSTGMFRALAIIIHINLGVFSKHAELVLLDDIGEGLDFERSSRLIKILVDKVKNSNIQVIMTSNDRFIMNAVAVDHWTVLDRDGHKVRAFNKQSNPSAFEDFKYSGLQNFDFFSMGLATETEPNGHH